MGIIYLGNNERVSRELAEAKEALDAKYLEVFGEGRMRRVDEVARATLVSDSFCNSAADFKKLTGYEIGGSNKLTIVTDSPLQIGPDYKIKERKIRTSPLFYISEEGFQSSASSGFTEKRVASYVHEFNHFIAYALQRVPIYVISLCIAARFGERGKDGGSSRPLLKEGMSRREMLTNINGFTAGNVIEEIYEKANRIIDARILEGIGIKIPLEWREKPRAYAMLPIEELGAIVARPAGGDPFLGLADEQVIERYLEWENYMGMTANPAIRNLVESVKGIRVSRLPFPDFRAVSDRR